MKKLLILLFSTTVYAAEVNIQDCLDTTGILSDVGELHCLEDVTNPPPPPPPPTGNLPYDLSDFNIPFVVTWPVLSIPVNIITISTLAEFQAAVQQHDIRVVVTSGDYNGNINITGNNVEILMSDTATLNGRVSVAPNQHGLHWVGGNVNMGSSDIRNSIPGEPWRDVSDHLFNNIQWLGVISYHTTSARSGNHRIAWINSTVDHTATAEEFCFHFVANARHSDVILANIRMEGDFPAAHSTTRLQSIDRTVIVDSTFNMGIGAGGSPGPEPGSTGNRGGTELVDYFMANSFVGGRQHFTFTDGGYNFAVQRAVFENVTRYVHAESNGGAFINNDMLGNNTGIVNNSQQHSTTLRAVGRPPMIAPMIGVNPPIITWDGFASSLPDVSRYGAQR